jgi:hypothetical protein
MRADERGVDGTRRRVDGAPRSDLDVLHEEFPGWRFGSVWASAASGPDARRIYAAKDGRLITAWTAAQLGAAIRREEHDGSR